MDNEAQYRRMKASLTEAITLAQETDDHFLEYMLGVCLAETQEKLKRAISARSARPARARRPQADARTGSM